MRRRRAVLAGSVLALVVTTCGEAGDETLRDQPATATTTTAGPAAGVPDGRPGDEEADVSDELRPRPPFSPPERVPAPPDQPPVTGEVPAEYLAGVTADAAARAAVEPSAVTVVRAEQVVWSDGSLGCSEPGMLYTQAPVDGFWVELEAGGTVFDYRLTGRGSFRLCESPFSLPPGDGPPTS